MRQYRAAENSEFSREDAKQLALQYFHRHSERTVLVGQISLWIGRSYGLNESEDLLEEMVREGFIQPASVADLSKFGYRHGYVLTTQGAEAARVA